MASLPYALSIHHFINSVGAEAGFASLIGLAILVLLYFAQARETHTLRDYAAEASERIAELEAHVVQLVRERANAHPATATAQGAPNRAAEAASVGAGAVAARVAPARQVAVAAIPAAPAGVAAPALAAATRLIPLPTPAPVAPAPAPVAPAPAPVTPAGAPVAPATGVPAPTGVPVLAAPASAPVGAAAGRGGGPLPAATVAGGTNGHGNRPFQPPPPRLQVRSATIPPSSRRAAPDPARSRRWLVPVIGAIGAIAIAVAVLFITGTIGSNTSTVTTSTQTSSTTRHGASTARLVNPATVTVAVLNGTTTNGLAHDISQKLTTMGYKPGNRATAADQTRTTTITAYLPGHKIDAQAVARSLKLPASSVQPVDSATEALACPPPGACDADVIVTLGADLDSTH